VTISDNGVSPNLGSGGAGPANPSYAGQPGGTNLATDGTLQIGFQQLHADLVRLGTAMNGSNFTVTARVEGPGISNDYSGVLEKIRTNLNTLNTNDIADRSYIRTNVTSNVNVASISNSIVSLTGGYSLAMSNLLGPTNYTGPSFSVPAVSNDMVLATTRAYGIMPVTSFDLRPNGGPLSVAFGYVRRVFSWFFSILFAPRSLGGAT